jgi:hypothetical protein
LAHGGAEAAGKHKIFLSMSYIGNDLQAEATNMVKAMASSKELADKVDLQFQVASPNAQRQIQQINAMVQAGAEAIVVFPISLTALNQVIKNACDKGVKIFAYDAEITEPCSHKIHIDQEEAGRVTAEWLAKKMNGKGNIVLVTVVPGTSVDTARTKAAKEVFTKYPDIKIVGEAVGQWSQAVARTELSKILATRNWDQIDGLWMQVGCFTANSMQLEAGWKPSQLLPCAGEGSNGGRIQMLPADSTVEGESSPYAPLGAAHFLCVPALFGRAGPETLGDYRIAQHSRALNLNLHHIVRLQPKRRLASETNAPRRSCGDHVAWRKRRKGRDVGDHGGYVEDQIVRIAVLHLDPVDTGLGRQSARIGDSSGVTTQGPKPPVAGKFL